MPTHAWKSRLSVAGGAVLAGLLFVLDLRLPQGLVHGFPYLAAVWLVVGSANWRTPLGMAVVCSGLTLIAGFLPADREPALPWFERIVAVVGLLGTGWVGSWYQRTLAAQHAAAAAAMQSSQQQLAAILDAAADGILTLDENGRVQSANRACRRLFGYEPSEMLGQPFDRFCSAATVSTSGSENPTAVRTGEAIIVGQQQEFVGHHQSGRPFPIALSLGKTRVAGTGIVTAIVHDLSLLKRINRELQQKNQEIELFVSFISHDLRGPLINCRGFLALLRERVSELGRSDVEEFVARIDKASEHVLELLDDLLRLSQIDTLRNEPERVDAHELWDQLHQDFAPQMRAANATLEIVGRLPTVWADRLRLRQAFENLLSNAIQHGCEGLSADRCRITVGAETTAGETRFFVRDNGPGIAPADHERIFEMRVRLRSDRPGTGIGLAIVARIAAAHHGRAWVESEPGNGATFWFALPFAPP